MSDSDLERIELKIAYLENANQELSDIVYRQQRELDALRAQLKSYQRDLEAWKSERGEAAPADERPPHY